MSLTLVFFLAFIHQTVKLDGQASASKPAGETDNEAWEVLIPPGARATCLGDAGGSGDPRSHPVSDFDSLSTESATCHWGHC